MWLLHLQPGTQGAKTELSGHVSSEPAFPANPAHLPPQRSITLGRKGCQVSFPHDRSISRVHALLTSSSPLPSPDLGSKYGVYVQGRRIDPDQLHPIQEGQSIQLGPEGPTFQISWDPLILATGHLDFQAQGDLQVLIHRLGGRCVEDVNRPEVTHILFHQLEWGPTLIQALLHGKWIVDPGWVEGLSSSHSSAGVEIPPQAFSPSCSLKVDHLLPRIQGVEWLKPNSNRKSLFQNMVCVMMDEDQVHRWKKALTSVGGRVWQPRYGNDIKGGEEGNNAGESKFPSIDDSVILVKPCGDGSGSQEKLKRMNAWSERIRIALTDEKSLYESLIRAEMMDKEVEIVRVTKDIQQIFQGCESKIKTSLMEPVDKSYKKRIMERIIGSSKSSSISSSRHVPWDGERGRNEKEEGRMDKEEGDQVGEGYMIVEEVKELLTMNSSGSSSTLSSQRSNHSSAGLTSTVANFKRFVKNQGVLEKKGRKSSGIIPVFEKGSGEIGSITSDRWLSGSRSMTFSSSSSFSSSPLQTPRPYVPWEEEEEEDHVNRVFGYSHTTRSTTSLSSSSSSSTSSSSFLGTYSKKLKKNSAGSESIEGSYSSVSTKGREEDEEDSSHGIMSSSSSSSSSSSLSSNSTVAFGGSLVDLKKKRERTS
ncbi:MAG: hypothetical protein DHS80DRAFT_22401 [Piptocephalis tieghemiana]|nr:MAG: hypothetical protein DHS80DRAFT_22401 [Piptocephalis tieghemiana]